MDNPFSATFGKKPTQLITRLVETNEIIENFTSENPVNQTYILVGLRGSGKTVMMTTVASEFRENKDWIVVELNATTDLLFGLAARLCEIPYLKSMFLKAKINVSAFGMGISVEKSNTVENTEVILEKMLLQIKKLNKRLLITIDEAVLNEHMRIFASSYQIFLRQELPVFLLMTGLYENVQDIQNDKSLTFLYRAPKINMGPLNHTAIRKAYMDIFGLDNEESEKMAVLTKGYPYAFQALGYIRWKNKNMTLEEILPEYDRYLDEYVYSKIWSEMSDLDKKIVIAMAVHGDTKVKDIRERLDMTSELFSVYRKRLLGKGLAVSLEYGSLSLTLPRIAEFIVNNGFE